MTLEFRSKDGTYILGFKGDLAYSILSKLGVIPELTKEVKRLGTTERGFKEYIRFTCIKECDYIFHESIDLLFNEGDYIKVVN